MSSRKAKIFIRQKTTDPAGSSSPKMQRHRGALARSRSIDHQLDEDRERRQKEIQLLILGGAGSGKSTFIKQLRIHHGDGFPEPERAKLAPHIYENIADAVNCILDNMDEMGIEIEQQENKKFATSFREEYPRWNHYCMVAYSANQKTGSKTGGATSSPTEATDKKALCGSAVAGARSTMPNFANLKQSLSSVLKLVADEGVKKAIEKRAEFQQPLASAESYFLDHLERIAKAEYVPSLQDVLYIRKPTVGVQEHSFTSNGLMYRVIDVAGQQNQRKKWIHFFDGVTAVIFFASLSGYCENLEEDQSQNSLQDSVQTFRDVCHNEFLERTDFILFLNKRDIFEEKLKTSRLDVCFPDYKGENTLDACTDYIGKKFDQMKANQKQLYTHISCAVNTDLMKQIINNVMQIIIEINLRRVNMPL